MVLAIRMFGWGRVSVCPEGTGPSEGACLWTSGALNLLEEGVKASSGLLRAKPLQAASLPCFRSTSRRQYTSPSQRRGERPPVEGVSIGFG